MALEDFLKIQDKKERKWVIWFSVAIFFLSTGAMMLTKLIEAFVIKRIGVRYLPLISIISAFSIMVGAWISLSLLRRWRTQWQSTLFGAAAVVGAFTLAVTQGIFSAGRPVLFNLIFVVVGTLIGTVAATNAYTKITLAVTDVFDYEQIQRLGPIFSNVVTVSVLSAGLLLVGLSSQISLGTMYLFVAILLLGSIPAYVMLGRMTKDAKAEPVPPEPTKGGYLSTFDLRRHITNPKLYRFLLLLSVIVGLTAIFAQIFQYAFDVVANERFHTEEALNAFFGGYVFLMSVGTFAFINIFQKKLFERYGLTNNLFTPPILVLIASVFMFVYPFFWVVIAVVFAREIIVGVQSNSYAAMMEGVGDYQRRQAWAWIRGPAHSAFQLAGAVLLLGVAYLVLPQGVVITIKVLAILAITLLLFRFLLSVRFKRAYPGVLLDAMEHGDFKTRLRAIDAMAEMRYMKDRHLGKILDLIRNEEEPVAVRAAALRALGAIKDPSVLRVVSRFIRHSDPQIRTAAIKAVSAFDYDPDKLYESGFSRHTLIADLREIMPTEKDEDVQNAILDALIALHDPEIIPHLIQSLKSDDPTIRHSVLRSMKKFKDPAIIDFAKPYLEDPVAHVKAQAIIVIWQFPWERQSYLRDIVDDMLKQDISSDGYRQGLYLSGALKLRKNRRKLLKALESDSQPMRITAAVALFKLGDNSGLRVAREAMAHGDAKAAHEIERLRRHPNVPEAQQAIIEALIHRYHLHYPQDLPVSEPLRVRLANIPKACFEGLLAYYAGSAARTERLKIERALLSKVFPPHRGRVVLAGLSDPWRKMAAIALLAHGYLVREASVDEDFDETAVVVADVDSDRFPVKTVILSESAKDLPIGQVAKPHYAPSELVTEVEKLTEWSNEEQE